MEHLFVISLDDAQERITDWQNDQAGINTALETLKQIDPAHESEYSQLQNSPVLGIEAFTFNLTDLQDFLNRVSLYNNTPSGSQDPIDAVRFYLGKKVTPELPVAPYACLVGVGVVDFEPNNSTGGKDITTLPDPQGASLPDYTGIYDFSYPCPTTCPDPGEGIMDLQQPLQS